TAGLLDTLWHYFRPRRVLIPVPAFSEYHRICAASHCEFMPFYLNVETDFRLDENAFITALLQSKPDLVLLNNPHNPSGSLLPHKTLCAIAEVAEAIGTKIVVDEAFIDYACDES